MLGIRMTKPDYDAVVFQLNPCDLERMSGVAPTPHGLIAVDFNSGKYTLAVPGKIQLECECDAEIIRY